MVGDHAFRASGRHRLYQGDVPNLDPDTGDWPEDALAGFLPPENDTGRGQGHFTFTIDSKSDLATGTLISNNATIVFDTEKSITTNTVTNTVTDAAPDASAAVPGITSGATGIRSDIMLNWEPVSYAAQYDVHIWASGTAKPDIPTAGNLEFASFAPENRLEYNTVYSWQVTARNVMGESDSQVWNFTTQDYAYYLRDTVIMLKVLAGAGETDLTFIPDFDGDGKKGLREAEYLIRRAAGVR